jgi:hypothetical protein
MQVPRQVNTIFIMDTYRRRRSGEGKDGRREGGQEKTHGRGREKGSCTFRTREHIMRHGPGHTNAAPRVLYCGMKRAASLDEAQSTSMRGAGAVVVAPQGA